MQFWTHTFRSVTLVRWVENQISGSHSPFSNGCFDTPQFPHLSSNQHHLTHSKPWCWHKYSLQPHRLDVSEWCDPVRQDHEDIAKASHLKVLVVPHSRSPTWWQGTEFCPHEPRNLFDICSQSSELSYTEVIGGWGWTTKSLSTICILVKSVFLYHTIITTWALAISSPPQKAAQKIKL